MSITYDGDEKDMNETICFSQGATPEKLNAERTAEGMNPYNNESTRKVIKFSDYHNQLPQNNSRRIKVHNLAIRCVVCNRLFADDGRSYNDHLPCGGAS